MNRKNIFIIAAVIILAGCNFPMGRLATPTAAPVMTPTAIFTVIPVQETAAAPSVQPTAAVTETSAATVPPTVAPTAIPTVAPTPLPSPSATSGDVTYTPFEATVNVNGLKIRTGPGYLFPALNLLAQNTRVSVQGRSPGDEWIYVQTKQDIHGWVLAQLLKSDKDLNTAPSVEPGDDQIIRGRVADAAKNPVNGIQFAITQGTGTNALRTDATTDANGDFYAFLPKTASGQWDVSFTAISCSSRLLDANCSCLGGNCGTISPVTQSINLPSPSGPLLFIWK